MDELGFFADPGHRMGFLDEQMLRTIRVVIDIGMHLGLEIPAESPFHPGERWTPELATEFFATYNGSPAAMRESEIDPLPGLAGPGHRLQARRARLAARPGGGPPGARRRLRPQGLAHEGAVPGRLRAGRTDVPSRRALRSRQYRAVRWSRLARPCCLRCQIGRVGTAVPLVL